MKPRLNNMFSKAKKAKNKQRKTRAFEDFRDINVSKSFRELSHVRRRALFSFTLSFHSHGVSFCKFLSYCGWCPPNNAQVSLGQNHLRNHYRGGFRDHISRTDPVAPLSRNFRGTFALLSRPSFFLFAERYLKTSRRTDDHFAIKGVFNAAHLAMGQQKGIQPENWKPYKLNHVVVPRALLLTHGHSTCISVNLPILCLLWMEL